MSVNEVPLVFQVLRNVVDSGAGDFNPGLGEERAGDEDESNVEERVEGVPGDFEYVSGGRDVVSESSDGDRVASGFDVLPLAEEFNEEVILVPFV